MYRDQSRNFYYDITISTPDGKRSARLTDTLIKQVVKADIIEAIASEEGQGASSLNLSFIEADFLPDDRNKRPIPGVAGRGYTTNRTGALIDIRFDGEKGFTYVTLDELQSGLTQPSRTQSGSPEPVQFMFTHNNLVEITWGYLEPRTSRTRKFRIGTVNYATGASGNTLSLECYTLQKELKRLKLDEGKVWMNKQDQPQSLKQVLSGIARVFGARLEFDEEVVDQDEYLNNNVPSEYVLDRTERGGDTKVSTNDNPLYLTRQQYLDDFIRELAIEFNSVYEVFEDPILNIPVIKFTAKKLRYSKVDRVLNYRDPDGIMLSFQYNTIAGEVNKQTSASAVDFDGKTEANYRSTRLTDAGDDAQVAKTYDPVPLVFDSNARKVIQRGLVGESKTVPSTSRSTLSSGAEVASYQNSFMGYITVKTVGHPDLQPGVIRIEGVGVRASTTYRFFQVQHSLSASGYTCSLQGKTQENVEEGLDNEEQLKSNEDYRTTQLFTGEDSGV